MGVYRDHWAFFHKTSGGQSNDQFWQKWHFIQKQCFLQKYIAVIFVKIANFVLHYFGELQKNITSAPVQERKLLLKKIGTLNERVAEVNLRKSVSVSPSRKPAEKVDAQVQVIFKKVTWAGEQIIGSFVCRLFSRHPSAEPQLLTIKKKLCDGRHRICQEPILRSRVTTPAL
jgi:hypothetical protein